MDGAQPPEAELVVVENEIGLKLGGATIRGLTGGRRE